MKNLLKINSLVIAMTIGLTACTTTQTTPSKPTKLTSETCATADWHKIGELDGQLGRYPYEFARYQKRCPSALDKRAVWEAGRQAGLAHYCTKANAFVLGQRGLNFNQVCPEEGLLELQQSHSLGYQQYYQEQRLFAPWYYGGAFGGMGYPYFW